MTYMLRFLISLFLELEGKISFFKIALSLFGHIEHLAWI